MKNLWVDILVLGYFFFNWLFSFWLNVFIFFWKWKWFSLSLSLSLSHTHTHIYIINYNKSMYKKYIICFWNDWYLTKYSLSHTDNFVIVTCQSWFHQQVVLTAWNSLTLSCHFISSILHPVFAQSWWMYVLAGWPTLGVHV